MALPQPTAPFTAEDYLRWEAGQPDKHEYDHGETFAMGGASRRHVTISLNIAAALDEALEGSPCRAYMADMKVQAAADEAYFYPDVLVTCDPADHRADQFMRSPTLIVEVLSPATAPTTAAKSSPPIAASPRCATSSSSTPTCAASSTTAAARTSAGSCRTSRPSRPWCWRASRSRSPGRRCSATPIEPERAHPPHP